MTEREAALREAFGRVSADYDAIWPRIIPRYQEFHQVIVQRLVEHGEAVHAPGARLVELGCGTGELSRRVLEALPGARLHCIDLTPAMIERARTKLARHADRVTFALGDFLSTDLPPAAGVFSALAIHHLDGDGKAALFRRVRGALARGGIFVMGDAVTGESEAYTEYYMRRWVDHMWDSGLSEDEVAGVLDDHARNDRLSSLSDQMEWLSAAGFSEVECLWKYFLLVVVAGDASS